MQIVWVPCVNHLTIAESCAWAGDRLIRPVYSLINPRCAQLVNTEMKMTQHLQVQLVHCAKAHVYTYLHNQPVTLGQGPLVPTLPASHTGKRPMGTYRQGRHTGQKPMGAELPCDILRELTKSGFQDDPVSHLLNLSIGPFPNV